MTAWERAHPFPLGVQITIGFVVGAATFALAGVVLDGIGGARPDGSGRVGLADRLAVLDGQLRVETLAEGGTLVAATIPVAS